MTAKGTELTEERLELRSRLSEMTRLSEWLEGLASRNAIPLDAQFAIRLCLEEALSNVIRHGYRGEPNHPLRVGFSTPREGEFVFDVEDEAPVFDPLGAPELPPLNPHEEVRVGGQGIRLLRRFADSLEYEKTPAGNRLRMFFSVARSA